MTPPTRDVVRARLDAARREDEVVSAIDPRALAKGRWWSGGGWPDGLRAGLLEPRRGYRYSPENLVLAQCLRDVQARCVVDLGAGSGSLLLIAAYLLAPERLVAVEQQAAQLCRLRRSFLAHGVDVEALEGDLRGDAVRGALRQRLGVCGADLILMNPPFFPSGWGRESRNESSRLSTHAENGDARDFLEAAAASLSSTGRLLVVFDAQRLAYLLSAATAAGLKLQRIHWIPDQRPGQQRHPFRVWVQLGHEGSVDVLEVETHPRSA